VFEATFGGAESNVAVALSQLGAHSAFVTVLPANPIGDAAIRELRRAGVDTGRIRRAGERVGIYYLEAGAAQRPSKVVACGGSWMTTPAWIAAGAFDRVRDAARDAVAAATAGVGN